MRSRRRKTRGRTITLKVKERELGGNGAEAYYTEYPRALLAIQPGLMPHQRDAREVEGHGYYRRPPKGGRKFCFAPRAAYDLDPAALNAIRCVVDDHAPSWVEEVKDAARMSNNPRWIADWCEMSVQVVVAILLNLKERGELPES